MPPKELEAILSGSHGDPFHVLGPHETDEGWEVSAFLPQAMDAAVSIHGILFPMRKLHSGGFFAATLPDNPGRYKLHYTLWNGEKIEFDDPYRFPTLLTDFDLHLYGEGT
ncbi:MAG TPA: 1,4-alpha-glucan branching enzyme, partial [Bryobacteraceae bacterium]|nr:1,4-alpha-glucan branching enzyme [Bryobacteraceae bacterium]